MLLFAFLACTAPASDTDTADTADSAEVEPVDVACGLAEPFDGAGEMLWGAWLEGRTIDRKGCFDGAPCQTSDGRMIEAEWHEVTNDRWISGYQSIRNENTDPTTRAYVYVWEDSTVIDECRITLL
jgi:hypothetical protein